MEKQTLFSYLDKNAAIFTQLSDDIWEHPELSLREYGAMERYCAALRSLGFAVETGIAGVPTAFSGTFGSGKPVIGFLGEYDALDSLSQEAGALERKACVPGGAGHGCGHNLLGAGALAAAAAVKDALSKLPDGSGTVIFYGCPGEEGGAGKAFMAREGVFKGLDAALTWHPEDVNEVVTGSCLASYQVEYKFTGVAAHAAGCPYMGRSALDAVELMNVGAQFLREHIPPHHGVHYAITDAGGLSPNVVQPRAQALYMLRADNVPNILKLAERVDRIAQGAAMMTDTTVARRFIDGTADTLPNETLEKLAYENFAAVRLPEYTPEERAFAEKLSRTYEKAKLPGFATLHDARIARFVREQTQDNACALNEFLMPLYHSSAIEPGSTDVGDVSRQTPTVQIHTATVPNGTPGHSWQEVSCGKSSIAHKGMLLAAKVLSATAWDLFTKPAVLKAAQDEFHALGSTYTCPIPQDANPVVAGESID